VQHSRDLEPLSDGELLQVFQQGNDRAFVVLYRRRHLEIYRYILQFVKGDEAAASDIFQDTFIKIHEHAHTVRDDNNVRSWMYTIARNNSLNVLKRRQRQIRLSENHEGLEDGYTLTPDQQFDQSTLHAKLDEAIRLLPENQREAVLLREFEGLSYAQIADATDTNIGIIRQRLWRAKQTLRTMLAPFFEDGPALGKEEEQHG
jgi:RNA polymerase sigma-70 factor (ECF subfamily)